MSEEDLELLITTDDPGEDTLEEDTFHDHPTEKMTETKYADRENDPNARDSKKYNPRDKRTMSKQ